MRRITLITIILLFPILIIHAQEATQEPDTSWEIIERCVGEPITPPDDWTFDGTILATGWAGIHGINADCDVPQVLAFNNNWNTDRGGSLSPDNRWFAVSSVNFSFLPDGSDRGFVVNEENFYIYDLANPFQNYSFDWTNSYEVYSGTGATRSYYQRIPRWINNETVLYQRESVLYEIDLTTQEVVESSIDWEPNSFSPMFPDEIMNISPDFSRTVFRENRQRYALVDMSDKSTLSYPAQLAPDVSGSIGARVNWSPDSKIFILNRDHQITLFDRDGNVITVISQSGTPLRRAFSSDSSKFVYFQNEMIHIADIDNQMLINTCFSDYRDSIVWSPSDKYIAIMAGYPNPSWQSDQHRPVYVFDLEAWEIYAVAYHDGNVIGWREE